MPYWSRPRPLSPGHALFVQTTPHFVLTTPPCPGHAPSAPFYPPAPHSDPTPSLNPTIWGAATTPLSLGHAPSLTTPSQAPPPPSPAHLLQQQCVSLLQVPMPPRRLQLHLLQLWGGGEGGRERGQPIRTPPWETLPNPGGAPKNLTRGPTCVPRLVRNGWDEAAAVWPWEKKEAWAANRERAWGGKVCREGGLTLRALLGPSTDPYGAPETHPWTSDRVRNHPTDLQNPLGPP